MATDRMVGADQITKKIDPLVVTANQGTDAASFAAGNHTHTAASVGAYDQATSDARYVNIDGDTMTGDLMVSPGDFAFGVFEGSPAPTISAQGFVYLETSTSGAPVEIGRSASTPHKGALIFGLARISTENPAAITDPKQLTTKEYVDGLAAQATLDARYVNVSGDSMTGDLTVARVTGPTAANLLVNAPADIRLQSADSTKLTISASAIVAGVPIWPAADPVQSGEVATKNYVDINTAPRAFFATPDPFISSGSFITTPDPAALAGATALDVRWIEDGRGVTGAGWLASQATAASANNCAFLVQSSSGSSGLACAAYTGTGSSAPVATSSSAPVRPPAGTIAACRMTWRASDGRVQWFNKATGTVLGMLDNTGWNKCGVDLVGAVGPLLDLAQPLCIGGTSSGSAGRGGWGVAAMSFATTIDGTPFAMWRADNMATQYTDEYGSRWTVNGSAWYWRNQNGLRIGSPNIGATLSGTGNPEGVVVATVGTRYVDPTGSANGAVEWVKSSGTGNTGWKVVYGDTGLRKLVSWDAAGVVTGGPLASGFAPRSGVAGYIGVRRINETVLMYICNMSSAAAGTPSGQQLLVTWSQTGFMNTAGSAARTALNLNGYTSQMLWITPGTNLIVTTAIPAATVFVDSNGYSATWQTADAWPTTLPGTP